MSTDLLENVKRELGVLESEVESDGAGASASREKAAIARKSAYGALKK